MNNSKTSDIYNYEFDWFQSKSKSKNVKDVCCEKYQKKKEKYCKSCPNKNS